MAPSIFLFPGKSLCFQTYSELQDSEKQTNHFSSYFKQTNMLHKNLFAESPSS